MMTKTEKFLLPKRLQEKVILGGETGMQWTCVRVILKNGKVFKNVRVSYGDEISAVYGYRAIPFEIKDIKDIVVTHREDYPKNFKGFV